MLANGTHKTISSRRMMGKEFMVPRNEVWDKFLRDKNFPVLTIRLMIFAEVIITKLHSVVDLWFLGHDTEEVGIILLGSMKVGNSTNRAKLLHAILNRIKEIRFMKAMLCLE